MVTFSRILALQVLEAPDYPGRSLVLYWLGTHRRILFSRGLGNICPTAKVLSLFYVAAVRTYQQLAADVPDANVLDTPALLLCKTLCVPEAPFSSRYRAALLTGRVFCSRTSKRPLWTSTGGFVGVSCSPGIASHNGVSRRPPCALTAAPRNKRTRCVDCVVARTVWTLVSRMFALPQGRHFHAGHRSSSEYCTFVPD